MKAMIGMMLLASSMAYSPAVNISSPVEDIQNGQTCDGRHEMDREIAGYCHPSPCVVTKQTSGGCGVWHDEDCYQCCSTGGMCHP